MPVPQVPIRRMQIALLPGRSKLLEDLGTVFLLGKGL